jgi:phosphoglycerate dehydrogenase-like enzyme
LAEPRLLENVEVLFTGWGAPVLNAELLHHATRLSHVFVAAGSIRAMTPPEFWDREIPIVSAAAANAIPVAEFTLAQILLGLKQAHRISRQIRSAHAYPPKDGVSGAYRSRVGLVSLGAIGQLVARQLSHFEVKVSAYDPLATRAMADSLGIELTTLEEVFATSDVVSIHTPLLPDTIGLVDQRVLTTMKVGATLINTARGAVVNERDLIAVLSQRPDLTAILDVTWPEPPAADSLLYSLPNVILTGHLAGAHGPECARMGELVADEMARLARGAPMLHTVERLGAEMRA